MRTGWCCVRKLYQSSEEEEEWTRHARKVQISVQEDGCKESLKDGEGTFLLSKEGNGSDRGSKLQQSLLEAWNADLHKALRICEERHVTVEGSEGSYVSVDRVDDPSLLSLRFFEDGFIFPSFLMCSSERAGHLPSGVMCGFSGPSCVFLRVQRQRMKNS